MRSKLSIGLREGSPEDLPDQGCHRQRKDGSLHGTDRTCACAGKTGDRPDPGDCADLSDGAAFLQPFWCTGIHHQFKTFGRGAVRPVLNAQKTEKLRDDRSTSALFTPFPAWDSSSLTRSMRLPIRVRPFHAITRERPPCAGNHDRRESWC